MVVLALGAAGNTWGLARRWTQTQIVQDNPVLR